MSITRRSFLLSATGLLALGGCESLPLGSSRPLRRSFSLQPPKTLDSAIEIEFATVKVPSYRRHVLQETWNQVDQQILDVERRKVLLANGIRVGISGTTVSPNMKLLLRPQAVDRISMSTLDRQMMDAGLIKPVQALDKHKRLSLNPGQTRDISLIGSRPEISWQWHDGETTGLHRLVHASSSLRVTVSRAAGTSIEMGVIPLLHHGTNVAKFLTSDDNFKLQNLQKEHLLPQAGFRLPLGLGETLILGPSVQASAQDGSLLGGEFFRSPDQPLRSQQVVMMRLVNAGESDLFGNRFSVRPLVTVSS